MGKRSERTKYVNWDSIYLLQQPSYTFIRKRRDIRMYVFVKWSVKSEIEPPRKIKIFKRNSET